MLSHGLFLTCTWNMYIQYSWNILSNCEWTCDKKSLTWGGDSPSAAASVLCTVPIIPINCPFPTRATRPPLVQGSPPMSTHTTYFITASKDDINITEVCLDLEQLAIDFFKTKIVLYSTSRNNYWPLLIITVSQTTPPVEMCCFFNTFGRGEQLILKHKLNI
jgi:hypothetical protein